MHGTILPHCTFNNRVKLGASFTHWDKLSPESILTTDYFDHSCWFIPNWNVRLFSCILLQQCLSDLRFEYRPGTPHNLWSILHLAGEIRKFLFFFSHIILGGFIQKEREESMMQCFVSVPEGVGNSTPPCWWDDCRYQIRGRPARPVVPFYSTSCVHVCFTPAPLSHRIVRFPWQMDEEKVRRVFREALKIWSDVTPLTFTEIRSGRADIRIDFTRWEDLDVKKKKTSLKHDYKRSQNTSRYYWKGVYLLCSNRTEKSF